ncbi:MAG TPA: winged helix-turn-helix domain-containing protein [Acidobacteriaceae bacterium]|jgi:TolB-like protein/DNA-binding winged helix-turn-helix (wHTH) protein|nr:winged helix-turn-helix domain-containing protein [Acidobacteriaceae bacterium]
MPGFVYRFGEFRLDADRFELVRGGHPVRLERKPLELLILLAGSGGRLLPRTEIAERLWNRDVYVDTEHGINTVVRKIRAALRDDPENALYIQTVTGMGYRWVAAVETETAAPSVAEPGPERLAGSEDVAVSSEAAPGAAVLPEERRSRRLWVAAALAAGVAVAVGLAVIGVHRFAGRVHGKEAPAVRSVAVLPLANYSGDPNKEYLAEGMTDELITMLAKESTLRVRSRTSVMPYKSTNRPLGEIARALDVDGIVEGSVSESAQGLHLTLQLIRADTDSHLWSESYDRAAGDAVALPEEAARAIAARLNSAAARREGGRNVSPEAHDAYLRGHYLWSVGRNEEAGREFAKAVRLQPDYALGWTGVSQYNGAGAFSGKLDPSVLPQAKAAAERAIQLDDTLPQAHSMLGAALFLADWDGPHALQEITRASEMEPGFAEAIHMHALILLAMGRDQEAVAVQKTAPDLFAHPAAMAEILYYAHEYDEALADGRMRLKDFPGSADLLATLSNTYHWKGRDRESARMLAQLYASPQGEPSEAVLEAFEKGGHRGVLEWQVAQMEKARRTHYVSPMKLAACYSLLGEREKTMDLLEEALRIHDAALVLLAVDPAFERFHADPRFRGVVARVGLATEFR